MKFFSDTKWKRNTQTNSSSTSLTLPPMQSWMPPKPIAKASRTHRSLLKNSSPRLKRKAYRNPWLLAECCFSGQLIPDSKMPVFRGCDLEMRGAG